MWKVFCFSPIIKRIDTLIFWIKRFNAPSFFACAWVMLNRKLIWLGLNIKIILFFISSLQQFFKIIICFSSSSINAKKKFWGVPHLLHVCVIFSSMNSFSLYYPFSVWNPAWQSVRILQNISCQIISHHIACQTISCAEKFF